MMKKLFSAIALVAMLASCGGGTKPYTINGTVSIDGIADGDTISLGYSVDGSEYIPESYAVVKDGKFITAKGMGSAVEFGLQIAENLTNPLEVKKIRASLQIYNG